MYGRREGGREREGNVAGGGRHSVIAFSGEKERKGLRGSGGFGNNIGKRGQKEVTSDKSITTE